MARHEAERLRILITTQSVRGYQNYVRFMHLGRGLVARGHDVTLVTTSPDRSWRMRPECVDGVRVLVMPGVISWRLRRGGLEPLDAARRVLHALRERYDVVHLDGHRPAAFLQTFTARLRHATPWVSEWVDLFAPDGIGGERAGFAARLAGTVEGRWEARIRLLADRVIAISRALYRRALSIGVPRERLHYLPGGCDVDRIPYRTVADARAALGLDPAVPVVGLVGYETADRKDVQLVLSAFSRLRDRFPGLRLMVTGKAGLDSELIGTLDLGDSLLLPGWVPEEEYPLWLAVPEVFALPFRDTERNRSKWPMKVGDFMAAGRPVVTNPTGDMGWLFTRHDVGLLVEPTVSGFEGGLTTFLSQPGTAAVVGRQARRVAESTLSWHHLATRLEAIYRATVAS